MQIYVCVKHVPDTAANIRVTGPAEFNESVKFIVNPYDEYGLEEAVQIVEKAGGEVVIVTVAKEAALTTVRSALAMGAARGILVKTEDQFLDSDITSQALKQAIEADGSPDIIFTGKQSIDGEGMQTQYRLARAFNMPVATEVVSVEIADGRAVVEREIGGGIKEVLEMNTPCVIGATKGLNEPRYPKFPDIMKAKKKEIKQIEIADLDIDVSAGKTEVVGLEQVPERSGAEMLAGNFREASEQLAGILMEKSIIQP
jgi:electron transfer flavoprotein beta subunit